MLLPKDCQGFDKLSKIHSLVCCIETAVNIIVVIAQETVFVLIRVMIWDDEMMIWGVMMMIWGVMMMMLWRSLIYSLI